MPADVKSEAEAAVAEARRALEGDNADTLKAAGDKLTQVAMKVGEAMYKAQAESSQASAAGAAPGGGPDAGARKPNDNVVDAEFEDVSDRKKAS